MYKTIKNLKRFSREYFEMMGVLTKKEEIEWFFEAIKAKDGLEDLIKAIGQNRSIINTPNPDYGNQTPLHYSLMVENQEALDYLLETKAKVDNVDDNGQTPIYYAIKDGNLPATKKLVENGAKFINIYDNENKSPFDYAVMACFKTNSSSASNDYEIIPERVELVKFLVSSTKEEWTPNDETELKSKLELAKILTERLKIEVNFDPKELYQKSLVKEESTSSTSKEKVVEEIDLLELQTENTGNTIESTIEQEEIIEVTFI